MGNKITFKNAGFTLIEILIGLCLASILGVVVFSFFSVQLKAFLSQKHIVDLQQNLRTCMYLLEEDIKHACYDPAGTAKPVILHADRDFFRFQTDMNENGNRFNSNPETDDLAAASGTDPNETIGFRLGKTENRGLKSLIREVWGGAQKMADNIEALDFIYLDSNGSQLSPLPLDAESRKLICSVEVTLVTRSLHQGQKTNNHIDYKNSNDDVLVAGNNDSYYRMSDSKIICLRNRREP